MFKRILVAIDGSPTAQNGLKAAMQLAQDQDATLLILHVVDDMAIVPGYDGLSVPASYVDSFVEALRETGQKTLAKAESMARGQGVAFKSILVETVAQTVAHSILAQARKLDADLIVLGTHGRRGLRRVLMGSDAEAVVREARVPVLLVRGSVPTRRAGPARTAKPAASPDAPVARRTVARAGRS